MKYLKKFEKKIIPEDYSEGLNDFFQSYNTYDEMLKDIQKRDVKHFYGLPDFVLDEYVLLNFYYNNKRRWKTEYKDINNYIKKEIKKLSIDNIVQKIVDNPENYTKLADSLEYVRKNRYPNNNITLFYIMFLFEDALEKVPQYIKNSLKYNL